MSLLLWVAPAKQAPRQAPSCASMAADEPWAGSANDTAIEPDDTVATAAEQCDAKQQARRDHFGDLLGTEIATPGAAFLAVAGEYDPGTNESVGFLHEDQWWNWERNELETTAFISENDTTCGDNPDEECPGKCLPDAESECIVLARRMWDAWGDAIDEAAPVWLDAKKQTRASAVYRADRCELRFQRYVAPRAWIAMTRTAPVPLGLVGARAALLPPYALETSCSWHDDGDRADACFEWVIPITGVHIQRALVTVDVKHGRVRRLVVDGDLDDTGGADEIHGLVRRYMDGPLRMTLETYGDSFQLDVRVN